MNTCDVCGEKVGRYQNTCRDCLADRENAVGTGRLIEFTEVAVTLRMKGLDPKSIRTALSRLLYAQSAPIRQETGQ